MLTPTIKHRFPIWLMARRIDTVDRIIVTVGKSVNPDNSCLRIKGVVYTQKPANHGVVIPALQVVQPGFLIVVIAAIADGIDAAHVVRVRTLISSISLYIFP